MKTTPNPTWTRRSFPISRPSLWDENARIPDYLRQSGEPELIRILFTKYGLERLAGEIVKDFDLPQLEKLVVWDDGRNLVVLEGNRRLAAYKCLSNPALVSDETLRKKFKVLKGRVRVGRNFRVEALVTTSKKEGMRFIDRKHYHGNHEKPWEQYERDHYIKRTREEGDPEKLTTKERSSIFRANLAEMVKRVSLPDKMKQEILGRGRATTFYRVVSSTPGLKKLKFEKLVYDLRIENETEFLALLKVIIFNLHRRKTLDGLKQLNSRTLNQESEIEDYLNSISISDERTVDELIAKEQPEQRPAGRSGRAKAARRRRRARAKPYNTLIDPQLSLPNRTLKKINSVYGELQEINVSDCPTAVSILVRILIEISAKRFLQKKNDNTHLNSELVKKISHIKNNYVTDTDLKKTIELLQNDLLTKNLNQVAHNTIFQATESSIKDLWKNLQHFFEFLVK